MTSTTCLKQDLSIDTTLDPSKFSLNSPFKLYFVFYLEFIIEQTPRVGEQLTFSWVFLHMNDYYYGLSIHIQRVELSGLGVIGQSDPFGVGWSQYVNVSGANHYSAG
jgi:hypothetical protein